MVENIGRKNSGEKTEFKTLERESEIRLVRDCVCVVGAKNEDTTGEVKSVRWNLQFFEKKKIEN